MKNDWECPDLADTREAERNERFLKRTLGAAQIATEAVGFAMMVAIIVALLYMFAPDGR